jgi:hypothetical protein
MIAVDARDGTNAVGREELLFVEHDVEHSLQLLGLDDRKQSPFRMTVVAHEGDRVSIGGGEIDSDGTWLGCGGTTILAP